LFEINGRTVGARRLDQPTLTIGRLASNDIAIPSAHVSRRHATVRWERGAWIIEDAQSLYGLLHEGRHVDRLVLREGDRVRLSADVSLCFRTTPRRRAGGAGRVPAEAARSLARSLAR
jgi:pSer/pThr/pTyr-binding forkhead associated (FHA) protein